MKKSKFFIVAILSLLIWISVYYVATKILACYELTFRNWVSIIFWILTVVMSGIIIITGIIKLGKYGLKAANWGFRLAAWAGVLILSAGFVFGGYLCLLAPAFAYHPEHIVEKDGRKLVASVHMFLNVDVYYYDYVNGIVRGTEYRLHEFYGNGSYDPFEREAMPSPIKPVVPTEQALPQAYSFLNRPVLIYNEYSIREYDKNGVTSTGLFRETTDGKYVLLMEPDPDGKYFAEGHYLFSIGSDLVRYDLMAPDIVASAEKTHIMPLMSYVDILISHDSEWIYIYGIVMSEEDNSYGQLNFYAARRDGTEFKEIANEDIPVALLTASEIDKKAETVYINNRNIQTLDFLADCAQLKELEISGCIIQESACLPVIDSLERLSVNYCGPGAIDIIKNNPHVRILSLSYNEIQDIGPLEQFHSLTELRLHGNNITDLSPLSGMSQLETLGLLDGNSDITTLKPLYGLEKLAMISIGLKVYQSLPKEEMAHFGNDPDDENAGIIMWD